VNQVIIVMIMDNHPSIWNLDVILEYDLKEVLLF